MFGWAGSLEADEGRMNLVQRIFKQGDEYRRGDERLFSRVKLEAADTDSLPGLNSKGDRGLQRNLSVEDKSQLASTFTGLRVLVNMPLTCQGARNRATIAVG